MERQTKEQLERKLKTILLAFKVIEVGYRVGSDVYLEGGSDEEMAIPMRKKVQEIYDNHPGVTYLAAKLSETLNRHIGIAIELERVNGYMDEFLNMTKKEVIENAIRKEESD